MDLLAESLAELKQRYVWEQTIIAVTEKGKKHERI